MRCAIAACCGFRTTDRVRYTERTRFSHLLHSGNYSAFSTAPGEKFNDVHLNFLGSVRCWCS